MSEETLRASDVERESAVRALSTHYADGRLDRAEFDERVGEALAARTRRELETLFADLPGPSPAAAMARPEPAAAAAESAGSRPAFRRGAAPGLAVRLLVPVLLVLAVLAAVHGAPPVTLIPLLFILRNRGRHWNREARPWG